PACDPGSFSTATDHVVTVVFTPPHGVPNAVAVAADAATCAALAPELDRCRRETVPIDCVPAALGGRADLQVVERDGRRELRFRFPDTDRLFLDADDDLTFTGPATVAVTRVGEPLPCDLARRPCAGRPGLLACIDDLFAADRACGTAPHDTFPHFTALPPPHHY